LASRSARVTSAVEMRSPKGVSFAPSTLPPGPARNALSRAQCCQPQEWLLVDHDPDLLERARGRSDLTSEPTRWISRDGRARHVLQGQDFVTASALLDLVSEDWLQAVCDVQESAVGCVICAVV
jgi:hypothetical protein